MPRIVRRARPSKPRRKAPGRRKGGKTRIPRGINDGGQMARIKETVEFQDLTPNTAYNFGFCLNQFLRASTVATNFKEYRASRVEWTIEPFFNTFTDDGTPQSIPYLYMTMNRTQEGTSMYLADMQAMGAKPQKLTSKRTIAYRPNWCSAGLITFGLDPTYNDINALTQNGLKAQYSYLAGPRSNNVTGPPNVVLPDSYGPEQAGDVPLHSIAAPVTTNQVFYNGHSVWIDQALPSATPTACARLTCTVHWEFRMPHVTPAAVKPPPAVQAVPKVPVELASLADTAVASP